MASAVYMSDQAVGAKQIRNNQRSEMVALALPAGKYVLIASGQVEGSNRLFVEGMIEFGATVVHMRGIQLEAVAAFLEFPTLFGVLDLPSGGTVRVNCLVSASTPGD